MGKPLIVIGDRLGKGQHVADGVVKAGGEAVVIPGMAADMKLGDVMKEKNADLGISFCGSGGAGALTAQNKYGYKCKYGMRSIEEGETAVANGVVALGFGFMDKEELGERIVKAWQKKNAQFMDKSSLKKVQKSIELEGYGKNRVEAIGEAFAKLKSESYKAVDGVLVDVHAVDVYIEKEEEQTKIKKLFNYFMPREIQNYYIKMKVILDIKYLQDFTVGKTVNHKIKEDKEC